MKRQTTACSILIATALLGACSTDADDPAPTSMTPMSMTPTSMTSASVSSAPVAGSAAAGSEAMSHNDADVAFNQMMIPHHQQAVAMAELVDERTTTPAVRSLAERIAGAQQPEIDQMTARLGSWGVPAEPAESGGHGGHGGHSMSGMMTDDEMAALAAARGTDFDRLWLDGMIRHHEGAVEMADDELARGIDGPSRDLAQQIKAAQQAEIDEMKQLLGQ
ncbi:DUF305 domain-containing protein [Gordonia sp. SID5947]|uniref:DUF305 domain-containing protein n=1 Tax=Gordonia sp. SID5947 TaxID=2690315 RepID=UPI001369F336|nr:DUF305 domain-containing protein [Gordonia sp. SID5947]MYR07145.1 DUF305 domain-containing protein [Gordonia sp. SID5947]